MRLSLRFIILSGFLLVLLPALILLSYIDFTKAKSNLENNFDFMVEQTAENITGAYDLVEVSFRILSLSLEDTMKRAFEPFIQDYYSVDGQVDKIDLAKIKKGLGEEFDLYIINDKGVIIHTTFEKDQDLNFHIDFITAAANLRARNYRIKEAPKHKCKLIAGKIIPAIATTTAAVTGLVMTEMYKVIQRKGMEAYRDSSNNLGINAYFFSEPAPADQAKDEYDPIMMEEVKCLPAGFTKWDKTEVAIDQGTTLKQFLEIFKKQTALKIRLASITKMSDAMNMGKTKRYRKKWAAITFEEFREAPLR